MSALHNLLTILGFRIPLNNKNEKLKRQFCRISVRKFSKANVSNIFLSIPRLQVIILSQMLILYLCHSMCLCVSWEQEVMILFMTTLKILIVRIFTLGVCISQFGAPKSRNEDTHFKLKEIILVVSKPGAFYFLLGRTNKDTKSKPILCSLFVRLYFSFQLLVYQSSLNLSFVKNVVGLRLFVVSTFLQMVWQHGLYIFFHSPRIMDFVI